MATGAVLAVVVRVAMFDHESTDYKFFVKGWYEFISTHGGFGALKYSFADYNVPYLYLIAALTYLPIPALIGVKIISVVFDLVLAYFTYRVVALRHTGRRFAGAGCPQRAVPPHRGDQQRDVGTGRLALRRVRPRRRVLPPA